MVPLRRHASNWRNNVAAGIALLLTAWSAIGLAEGVSQATEHGRPPVAKQQGNPEEAPGGNQSTSQQQSRVAPSRPLYARAACEHGCGYSEDDKGWWQKLRTDPVATFTAILTLATIGLGWVTYIAAVAAKRAADAIPVLERAYLYSIEDGNNIKYALALSKADPVQRMLDDTYDPDLWVRLKLKNYGKTPARLVSGEAMLSVTTPTPRVGGAPELPIKNSYVLGEGEESEPFDILLAEGISAHDAVEVEAGRATIVLWGYMDYLDIWGEKYTYQIRWTYNLSRDRMLPGEPKEGAQRRQTWLEALSA